MQTMSTIINQYPRCVNNSEHNRKEYIMKEFIVEFINALDYRNEFTTEEAVVYTVLAIVIFILAACGESIILSVL